ncbi:MAG: hypothetical protein ACI8W8_002313 [Rhodothermales bacterium]
MEGRRVGLDDEDEATKGGHQELVPTGAGYRSCGVSLLAVLHCTAIVLHLKPLRIPHAIRTDGHRKMGQENGGKESALESPQVTPSVPATPPRNVVG